MATGFAVDPSYLEQAAACFASAAEVVDQAVALLSAGVSPGADLFGLLPEGQAALESYRERSRQAAGGLSAAAAALGEDVAGGLRATAAGYLRAEEANLLR